MFNANYLVVVNVKKKSKRCTIRSFRIRIVTASNFYYPHPTFKFQYAVAKLPLEVKNGKHRTIEDCNFSLRKLNFKCNASSLDRSRSGSGCELHAVLQQLKRRCSNHSPLQFSGKKKKAANYQPTRFLMVNLLTRIQILALALVLAFF